MTRYAEHGVVNVEDWRRIGAEDEEQRAARGRRDDALASVLTAVSGFIVLVMLAIGPVWTVIVLFTDANERSSIFDEFWVVPFVVTLLAAPPLAWALHREPTRGRWMLVAFLGVSLAIQLVTCPWL